MFASIADPAGIRDRSAIDRCNHHGMVICYTKDAHFYFPDPLAIIVEDEPMVVLARK